MHWSDVSRVDRVLCPNLRRPVRVRCLVVRAMVTENSIGRRISRS